MPELAALYAAIDRAIKLGMLDVAWDLVRAAMLAWPDRR